MQSSLTKQQNMMVGTIWITYACFYLGRVNVSVVLPLLAVDLNLSRAEVGALGTVFFWVYGIFHFVSGELGTRVSPYRMVSLALLGIALVNIAFAFQTSLAVMLLLWGLNGVAQSGGWSPMFRILAERLERSQIKKISTLMPFSYVFGTVITWTLIGLVAGGGDWRIAFWLPGILLLLVLAFWRRAGIDAPKARSNGVRLSVIIQESRGIAFALLAAALCGFVFNGAIIWLPTYILDSGLIAEHLVGQAAALMQVIAIGGIALARIYVRRSNQVFVTAALMLTGAGVALLLLTVSQGWFALLVMVAVLVMLNGAFGLTVSSLPFLLAPPGRTSSVTGTINMMSNFFGGMAGFSVGALVELSGWALVFALWGILLLLAALVIWRQRAEENRRLEAA